MPKPLKEKVEKVCENCGNTFLTKFPNRARFCPGSKCRSEAWDKEHRVQSKEYFAREALREYWRAEWRRNGQARRARRRQRKKNVEA